jgi:hypothetical protein
MRIIHSDHQAVPSGGGGQLMDSFANKLRRVIGDRAEDAGEGTERDWSGRLRGGHPVGLRTATCGRGEDLASQARLTHSRRARKNDAVRTSRRAPRRLDEPQFLVPARQRPDTPHRSIVSLTISL